MNTYKPRGLHLALTWRYMLVTIGALLLIAAVALVIAARFLPPYTSGMQEMDGVEATAQVRRVSPRTRIVVLTSHHTDEHIFPAIRAGALSYILKDIRPKDMLEAIRVAARGEATINAGVAARLISEMHKSSDHTRDPFFDLTARERDVLHLIADGLTNKEIAEELVLSLATVKGYVSNILGKLHLADRTQAAVMAWREGFKQ